MKTPMQRLKEILLNHREYNITNFIESTSNTEGYEARIFLCEDILESIDSYFLEQEKEIIIHSHYEGAKGWIIEHTGGASDYDKKDAEQYYNETFNTKEK